LIVPEKTSPIEMSFLTSARGKNTDQGWISLIRMEGSTDSQLVLCFGILYKKLDDYRYLDTKLIYRINVPSTMDLYNYFIVSNFAGGRDGVWDMPKL